MEPLIRETVAQRIEQMQALDAPGQKLQQLVRKLVPQESELKDLLSGTWWGHPLHPVLTDVVIGSWTSASFLDLFGGKEGRRAADRLIGIGILSAIPTAAAGLSDWAELSSGERRIGTVHAAGNTTALSLYTLSWVARRRGRRLLGVLLALMGSGAATASAYLGGHLSFGKGVGVNQTAFEPWPKKWTAVMDETELVPDRPTSRKAGDMEVLLYRSGPDIYALADKCSHRGCSLHTGEVEDLIVTCPCHGSSFRLQDGSIVRGPVTAPQPPLEVRTNEGKIEVRARIE